jgi:hypothetical protein
MVVSSSERRTSRRFSMNLPMKVRVPAEEGTSAQDVHTRDVSFRGLYFVFDANIQAGSEIEFVLTLPKEITLAGDVHIRCLGSVVRVDDLGGRHGIAARIERYEFLPTP